MSIVGPVADFVRTFRSPLRSSKSQRPKRLCLYSGCRKDPSEKRGVEVEVVMELPAW